MEYLTALNIPPILQEMAGGVRALGIGRRLNPQLHLNYHSIVPGYLLARRFKRADIPNLMDLADDLPNYYRQSSAIPRLARGLASHVSKAILSDLLESSDFITATSESLLQSYGIPRHKREIVPNGVDTASFYPMDVTIRRRELGLEDRLVIGYVGVLREWVDFELLLDAANEVNHSTPVTLLLVGGGSSTSSARRLARGNVGRAEIRVTGPVPYTEVPIWMNLLDVGVVPFKPGPMTHHSLPMKIFEYMACAKPVISTPLETVMKTVGNHIYYASNSSELAEAIETLWRERDATNRLVDEALRFVRERYDWQMIEARLHQIYTRFLARD